MDEYYHERAPQEAYVDEASITHATKLKDIVRDYRHNFEQTHCRVHYCHTGHGTCPICPVVNACETLADDTIEKDKLLAKKLKVRFVAKARKNGSTYWVLSNIS